MKKIFTTILHFALIGVVIHFSGCKTQEHTQRITPNGHILNAKENIKRAKKSEQNKNLAEALYFYKAAAEIYEKKKKETHLMISRVSKKINHAQKYVDDAILFVNKGRCAEAQKLIDNAFAIRNDHPKSNELKRKIQHCKQQSVTSTSPRTSTPPTPYQNKCKFLKGKQYEHIVKRGDELGQLCKRIYGQTGHFKLVHAIVEYNRIDPNNLKKGQRIKFPIIKCKNSTYNPTFPYKTPPKKPTPAPTLPTPFNPEETYKHEHYSQGVEHLKKELFDEAKYEFDLVIQKDTAYLDVMRKMEKATLGGMIKDGRDLFDKAQYDKAITMFQQVYNLQRDNGIAIEYLHKAYFEKAASWYKGQQRSKALTNFKKCFNYYHHCRKCKQYKKNEKKEIISKIALSLERESKRNIRKDILQQQVKALKLLKILEPDNQKVNRRLAEAQKLLEGFN